MRIQTSNDCTEEWARRQHMNENDGAEMKWVSVASHRAHSLGADFWDIYSIKALGKVTMVCLKYLKQPVWYNSALRLKSNPFNWVLGTMNAVWRLQNSPLPPVGAH